MNIGDYVLATKWGDGDPGDQFAIGFYAGTLASVTTVRHMVQDTDGKQFRGNGFRRCESITQEEGAWMLAQMPNFRPLEYLDEDDDMDDERYDGKSVWDWLAECRTAGPATDSQQGAVQK